MNKRTAYFFLCFIPLTIGGGLYLLYRESSYITVFAEGFLPIEKVRMLFNLKNSDFLNYYFPDFLWAFSYYYGVRFVLHPNGKMHIAAVIVAVSGILWELFQYLKIVKGTGDFYDVLMYLIAVVFAVLIEKILKKRTK